MQDSNNKLIQMPPKPPYDLKINRKYVLMFALGCSLLAFLLSIYWGMNLIKKNEKVAVIVAVEKLSAPRIINAKDFSVIYLPNYAIPQNAIKDIKNMLNNTTLMYPLDKGQILTRAQIDPLLNETENMKEKNNNSYNISHGFRGMILPSSWFINPIPRVKAGDTISIALVLKNPESNLFNMKFIKNKIKIISVNESGSSISSIMVEVDDKTMAEILENKVNNYSLSLVLDSK